MISLIYEAKSKSISNNGETISNNTILPHKSSPVENVSSYGLTPDAHKKRAIGWGVATGTGALSLAGTLVGAGVGKTLGHAFGDEDNITSKSKNNISAATAGGFVGGLAGLGGGLGATIGHYKQYQNLKK